MFAKEYDKYKIAFESPLSHNHSNSWLGGLTKLKEPGDIAKELLYGQDSSYYYSNYERRNSQLFVQQFFMNEQV